MIDMNALANDFVKNLKQVFDNRETINIFDNYSVINTDKEYLKSLADALAEIGGLKEINIYMKRDKNKEIYLFIKNLPTKKSFTGEKLKDKENEMNNNKENYKYFAEQLKKHKICCNYVVYKASEMKNDNLPQKLHGRYWLHEDGGLIVDGSMNTSQKSVVLAQQIDRENFGILKPIVEEIINNTFNKKVNLETIDGEFEKAIKTLKEKYLKAKTTD